MDWVVGAYTDVFPEVLVLKKIREEQEQDMGLFLLEEIISIYLRGEEGEGGRRRDRERKNNFI